MKAVRPLFVLFLSLFSPSCKHDDSFSSTKFDASPQTQAACSNPADAWCKEYQTRVTNLNGFLKTNGDDYKSFASASLGHAGFPYILLRLAPELFPDLVAGQGKNFSRLGFRDDPFNPSTGLPLGLNYRSQAVPFASLPVQTPIKVATLTCGACHIGRVEGPDGRSIELVGAGNSHFDSTGLFKLFGDIVKHKNYNASAIRAAVLSKPVGYFYGGSSFFAETAERTLYVTFTDSLLAAIKKAVIEGHERQDKFINQQDYVRTGAYDYFSRTPGRADAVGLTLSNYASDDQVDKMPGHPTITKIMSVWSQKDRTVSHWTSDMPSGVSPVVAAEVAVIGDTALLDKDNILRSTRFIRDLPPPPYPFAVDMQKAATGKALYDQCCAS